MCWRTLLRVPWTARRSNQSILKEIRPEYSLEGLMLKLKLQNFGHLMWRTDIWKYPDPGRDWGQEKGMTEDEMVGWHHRFDGHEFEQAPGVADGQGSLACCSPWGRKELDMIERLNWTESNSFLFLRDCWLLVEVLVLVCRCKLHNTVSWAQSNIFKWLKTCVLYVIRGCLPLLTLS